MEEAKISSPFDFCRIYAWHSSTTMGMKQLSSRKTSFHNMFWNFASKKSTVFQKQRVFHFANQKKHVLPCWQTMEGIPNSFISSTCFNIKTSAFLSPLHRVDMSDFPQTRPAKLQLCLSTKEDEQHPLSVHLWAKKCYNFSPGFYFKNKQAAPLWMMACNSDDNCCKPQNAPGDNHGQPLSRWYHFCRLSTS